MGVVTPSIDASAECELLLVSGSAVGSVRQGQATTQSFEADQCLCSLFECSSVVQVADGFWFCCWICEAESGSNTVLKLVSILVPSVNASCQWFLVLLLDL